MANSGALITLSGYPSSGKTTRALQLVAFLNHKLVAAGSSQKVVLINDESLHISKSAYDDSKAEKPARATLFSAVTRSMNPNTIVVVDAMNYIKGSRYQMYCNAREVSSRTCTIFVATPPDKCREWNGLKPEAERYAEPTLENLISRYEEPNSAARWDAPLFTVATFDPPFFGAEKGAGGEGGANGQEEPVASSVAEQIWEAISTGDIKPPNVATLPIAHSTTTYLTRLETTTSLLITALLARQSLSPLSGSTPLVLPTTLPIKLSISITKSVTMSLLQRLKRQFTKLNVQGGRELTQEKVATLFAEYLEAAIQ